MPCSLLRLIRVGAPDDRRPRSRVSLDYQEDKLSAFVRFFVKDRLPRPVLLHANSKSDILQRSSALGNEHLSSFVDHQGLRRLNVVHFDLPLEIAGHRESIERGTPVPKVRDISASDVALLGGGSANSPGDPGGEASACVPLDGPPCLRVRNIDGNSVVHVLNAEVLVDWDMIRNLSIQLHLLVEEGHCRLLLNFSRIRYMSSDVLGTLAMLHRQLDRSHGRLALCGLDPVLREMMRICCLEQVFDIYANESEALVKVKHSTTTWVSNDCADGNT